MIWLSGKSRLIRFRHGGISKFIRPQIYVISIIVCLIGRLTQRGGLLNELPVHLETMARFSLLTGLRESNVTKLEWNQIDLQRHVAWIHPDQAMTEKALGVPLNNEAVNILRSQIGKYLRYVFVYKGKPVLKANNHAWRKALNRAGITHFRWHDLRHTWAS